MESDGKARYQMLKVEGKGGGEATRWLSESVEEPRVHSPFIHLPFFPVRLLIGEFDAFYRPLSGKALSPNTKPAIHSRTLHRRKIVCKLHIAYDHLVC